MRSRIAVALSLVMLAAGCETTESAYRPGPNDDPTWACFEALFQDARLRILDPKVGDVGAAYSATVQQLGDTSYPTEREREAAAIWGNGRIECLDRGESFRRAYAPPGYAITFRATQMDLAALTANLYSGAITFGEFNRDRNRIAASAEQRMDAARRQDVAESQAAIARQQQAVDAMLRDYRRTRPTVTECTPFGQTISCTTR